MRRSFSLASGDFSSAAMTAIPILWFRP